MNSISQRTNTGNPILSPDEREYKKNNAHHSLVRMRFINLLFVRRIALLMPRHFLYALILANSMLFIKDFNHESVITYPFWHPN